MLEGVALFYFAVSSFFTGVFALLGLFIYRMLRSDGWDKSNITNALRLLSHVAIHPEDFGHMYYTVPSANPNTSGRIVSRRVFTYISKDELSEVVPVRPTTLEKRP